MASGIAGITTMGGLSFKSIIDVAQSVNPIVCESPNGVSLECERFPHVINHRQSHGYVGASRKPTGNAIIQAWQVIGILEGSTA